MTIFFLILAYFTLPRLFSFPHSLIDALFISIIINLILLIPNLLVLS